MPTFEFEGQDVSYREPTFGEYIEGTKMDRKELLTFMSELSEDIQTMPYKQGIRAAMALVEQLESMPDPLASQQDSSSRDVTTEETI